MIFAYSKHKYDLKKILSPYVLLLRAVNTAEWQNVSRVSFEAIWASFLFDFMGTFDICLKKPAF